MALPRNKWRRVKPGVYVLEGTLTGRVMAIAERSGYLKKTWWVCITECVAISIEEEMTMCSTLESAKRWVRQWCS